MSIIKQSKDYLTKLLLGKSSVPSGLFDSREYFRLYGPIHFQYEKNDDLIIAKSVNFGWGSIITSGKNEQELDKNIKDAILTSFEIPSSYASEAKIERVEAREHAYALA
ncbi:MAG: hypothetical protein PHU42_03240 [Patescibacteria group bacterium]|nr:hypothetical protein [Patescibacteria group bacterium]